MFQISGFYLKYKLFYQKPAHFLSAQMALVSTFFQMFIVLGMYYFGWNQTDKCWARIMIIINFMVILMNLCLTIGTFGVNLIIFKPILLLIVNHKNFRLIFDCELNGKRSRAEPNWKSFSPNYGSSQLGSDSLIPILLLMVITWYYKT